MMIKKIILKNKKFEALALKSPSGGFRGRGVGGIGSFGVLKGLRLRFWVLIW